MKEEIEVFCKQVEQYKAWIRKLEAGLLDAEAKNYAQEVYAYKQEIGMFDEATDSD